MSDPPKLKLVEHPLIPPDESEFLPLPFYPWDRRPSHLPLDVEEVATALYLGEGVIGRAADRLKTEPLKVVRQIARSARLQRLHAELAALLNDRVHEEYVKAFTSEDDRRREWAASARSRRPRRFRRILSPRTAISPLPKRSRAVPVRIVISWEDAVAPLTIEPAAG